MKKRALVIALILAFMLSMTAYAVEPRTKDTTPVLSFDGTTANCSVTIVEAGAEIEVTLRLYKGIYCMNSWPGSGTGYVKVSGTHIATAGDICSDTACGAISSCKDLHHKSSSHFCMNAPIVHTKWSDM